MEVDAGDVLGGGHNSGVEGSYTVTSAGDSVRGEGSGARMSARKTAAAAFSLFAEQLGHFRKARN